MSPPVTQAWSLPDHFHIFLGGSSGKGKTRCILLIARAKLKNPAMGLQAIDPDGDLTPYLLETIANPANGLGWRRVHHFKPASSTHTFGLPLLSPATRLPLHCNEAALRTLQVFEQVLSFGASEYGPRIRRLFHLGCYGLALAGRPLLHLPELFALGAKRFREHIGESFPYSFMAEDWHALDVLSDRNPLRFQEYTEAIMSRLMPIFANPRLRCLYGQQQGINFSRMLDNRDVGLLDLSGLEHKDAVLVGTSYYELLHQAALARPPETAPRAICIIDEVFDYLTPNMARGFDRLRKRNIQLLVAAQRLGQLAPLDDRTANPLNAILTNTQIKICFGGLAPDDAELMGRVYFLPHIRYDEFVPGTERPVAVGQSKRFVESQSHTDQVSETDGRSHTSTRSHSSADGTFSMEGTGYAEGDSVGDTTSQAYGYHDPENVHLATLPTTFVRAAGAVSGHSTQRSSFSGVGASHIETCGESEADTDSHSATRGSADTRGTSEVFVTDYQWLPTKIYSGTEQMMRLTGELMALPARECFVQIQHERPFRTRTADLPPAFRSAAFRRQLLPRYLEAITARSPYLRPIPEVEAEIAARLERLLEPPQKPEPDFEAGEPIPPIADTDRIAVKLPLRIIDGGKGGGDKQS